MRNKQTFNNFTAKLLLCVVLFLAVCNNVKAQINAGFTTVLMNDSLVAVTNKDFLYNTITINNTSTDKMTMVVTITAPSKWSLVTDNVINVSIDPNSSTIIPIRLFPKTGNTAVWQDVKIEYRVNGRVEVKTESFRVRVQEFSKFKSYLVKPTMVMEAYQRNISIPIYIKNSGNTTNTYSIACKNEYLHLDAKSEVSVNAASDTTYEIPLTLTENEFAMMKKEEVSIVVSCKSDVYNLPQIICKIGSVQKDHMSAYQDMPLQLEAGVIYQGAKMSPQYYGGLYGSVDIDSAKRLSVAYRSSTMSFSNMQGGNNGLIKADYTEGHYSFSAGNIQEINDFSMSGYGVKAGYNWNSFDKLVVYGILKSKTGNENIFGGIYQHTVNKKIKVIENVSTDLNRDTKLNSAIARQTVNIDLNDHIKGSVITGASAQQNNAQMESGQSNVLAGTSIGYDFHYNAKNLKVASNMLDNSNNFAGIYIGQKIQTHDARFILKKTFLGAFYEANSNTQNYFADSVVMKNVFGISNSNYGLRSGLTTKLGNIVVSAGDQKQIQSGEGNNFQTDYKYVSLNTSLNFTKKISMVFNTFAGEGAVESAGVKNVFSTSTQGSLQVYNGGMTFQYSKGPFYYNDYAIYLQNKQSVERFILSPYVDFNLFKNSFTGRAQFNYSGASNTGNTSAMLLNLGYNNFKKGYDMHITGMIPVNSQNGVQPYVTATMRCRLTTPCVAVKKYHTVSIFLFKDANSDGEWQEWEEPVVGQTVSINGSLFISDENGMITFKNVADGIYTVDFGYSSKVKGWTPGSGNIRKIQVDGSNAKESIAFRKARVLDGSLNVIIDSNSNLRFSPSNIKVTVTSSGSAVYTTLTDEKGNFSFNLPEGNYTVSLSTTSFDEFFRPTEYSHNVDLTNNQSKTVYFEIRQKKRQMNIKKG